LEQSGEVKNLNVLAQITGFPSFPLQIAPAMTLLVLDVRTPDEFRAQVSTLEPGAGTGRLWLKAKNHYLSGGRSSP
jgi:hypothetical protein